MKNLTFVLFVTQLIFSSALFAQKPATAPAPAAAKPAAEAPSKPTPIADKVSKEICDCTDKMKLDTMGFESIIKSTSKCMQQPVLANMEGLKKEFGITATDQGEVQGLVSAGVEKKLVTSCVSFQRIYVGIQQIEQEQQLMQRIAGNAYTNIGEVEGTVARVERTPDFIRLVITNAEGKEESFIVVRIFPGEAMLTDEASAATMKGKKVVLVWAEYIGYVASKKNYETLREIVLLEEKGQ